MNTLSRLEPGYYGGLQRSRSTIYKGGLDWSGEGRGCNTEQGWFVVDNVTYFNGFSPRLTCASNSTARAAVPLCTGPFTELKRHHGATWTGQSASCRIVATGPRFDSGYRQFRVSEKRPGDYIGAGQTLTYTPSNTTLSVNTNGGHLSVNIGAFTWSGDFQTMNTLSQFQFGYYGGLERYPFTIL